MQLVNFDNYFPKQQVNGDCREICRDAQQAKDRWVQSRKHKHKAGSFTPRIVGINDL